MMHLGNEPKILEGGVFTDARGRIVFANDFTFEGIKRFYMVENEEDKPIRAWHGHLKEAKFIFPVAGSVRIGAVFLDDAKAPKKTVNIHTFKMKAGDPGILYVPAGYANGWMSLEKSTRIMYFSDVSLEESEHDDYRFPWDYWGREVWEEHT